MNNYIYVNCGGSLDRYNSKEEAMSFFEDCIYSSEGSERERYTEIYFSIKENLMNSKRCFTDGTDRVYDSNILSEDLSDSDEKLLLENYGINKDKLLYFEARNYLTTNNHKIIYNDKKLNSISDIYDYYVKDSTNKSRTFFLFKDEKIICIDDDSSNNHFYTEFFDICDYKYADKWLKNEIEYEDYLKEKNSVQNKKSIGNYNGEDLYLVIAKYQNNGRTYLGLETQDGEPFADITINLSDLEIVNNNFVFLSGDLSNELKEFLIDNEIIDYPIDKMQYNMGRYDLTMIDINKLKEYDIDGYNNSFEDNDIEM